MGLKPAICQQLARQRFPWAGSAARKKTTATTVAAVTGAGAPAGTAAAKNIISGQAATTATTCGISYPRTNPSTHPARAGSFHSRITEHPFA